MFYRPCTDLYVINPIFTTLNAMYITTYKLPYTLYVICLFCIRLGIGVSAYDVDAIYKQDYVLNKRIERFM